MKTFRHILLVCIAASALASCGQTGVIPKDEFSEIYAEMLLTDQWMLSKPGLRSAGDTLLVYEPILNKYGYTSEDYRKSMSKYMEDPDEYEKILSETVAIFDRRLAELEVRKVELQKQKELEEYLAQFYVDIEFDVEERMPYLYKEPYVHYYDSLAVEVDTTDFVFKFVNYEVSDTTYEGIRMLIKSKE